MLQSRLYIPTLKETPAEAEVVSHKLLLRAGMIRKITSGIYTYLPLGLRSLEKISRIVREEMNAAGAQEILMPMVQPADLWQESGRWDHYGKELLRLRDRHDRDYCLGPTHEEVVTSLVRDEVRSYRQLPINVYQIQTKFRDEIRPRFGLMRGREFIMKDAYSFDRDEAGADASYQAMYDAYTRIFTRLGLRFRAVAADTGSIGGSFSHEFMVLAETGEDTLAVCRQCAYAANVEKAEVRIAAEVSEPPSCPAVESVATPGARTVEEVAAFLGISPQAVIKTVLMEADGNLVAVLVRGDREANVVKVKNVLGAAAVDLASPEVVERATGAPVGFAGPVGLSGVPIYVDQELTLGTDYVCGANAADMHLRHVDLRRDVAATACADLRTITPEDPCPACGGAVALVRGIEVGHVFKLGTKYSEAMHATFLDENGRERLMIMGCYGIGVSRVLAACIEQNHDDAGMILPPPVAPFEIHVLPLSVREEAPLALAQEIHDALTAQGIDTLLDDRDERPGVKFSEADLLGAPMQVIVGAKGLARGVVEVKDRRTGVRRELPADAAVQAILAWRTEVLEGWCTSLA
ncbi:MAG: proline--tRNA ligase [Desulfomicrobiaceae bacterium]|nr:proline--tRNA ligase [Desulfomicrobiaceae bacterium]